MSLMDDIRSEVRARGTKCSVKSTIASLEGADRRDLAEAVAEPTVTAAAIERAMKRRDVKLTQNSISRHRRGDCTCPRPTS